MFATRLRLLLVFILFSLPLPLQAQVAPDAGPDDPATSDEPTYAPASTDALAPTDAGPTSSTPAAAAPPPPPADAIERPELVRNAEPVYPSAAWHSDKEADVTVTLTLSETGEVAEVELGDRVGDGFDQAALAAAHKLLFKPATVNGVPVAVQIRFTFRFRKPEKVSVAAPPPEAALPVDARKPGTIKVTVYERGKGKPLSDVEVYILDHDKVILTDKKGHFEYTAAPGAYAFTIRPPGFYPFMATERIEAGETIKLKYYVRRRRRDRYSTIVWGSEGRAEVARTTLQEDEIRTVAGTMGDPIRVISLLPGASSSVSGLGYPLVRGSLPGDSLYEIDGIRIPMLYHLLFGPAVVHPQFVDEIIFQPGGYSAKYGRFPGARIGATTARVQDDAKWVADLSIVETSLFRSQKFSEKGEMIAAVRYGTLGYIIEGLAANTIFRYWDYQTRVAYRLPNDGKLTLTLMGASDTAGESNPATGEEDVLSIGFHTADIRYQHGWGKFWFKGGSQVSHEFFQPPTDAEDDDVQDTTMNALRPYAEIGYATDNLELSAGTDLEYQDFGLKISEQLRPADTGLTLGLWTAAEWEIGAFVINPSVRIDNYRYHMPDDGPFAPETIAKTAVDPRLSTSYKLFDALTLKASFGIHSGPSRISFVEPPIVFGPVPGFEGAGLQYDLQRSRQMQAGIETRIGDELEFNLTGFYHQTQIPIDFSLLNKELRADTTPCNGNLDGTFTSPFDIEGRSYGAEMLLRRRLGQSVFGWMSYAISRSERDVPGVGVLPFDFDQTHVFNGVLSWEVGRNWTLGSVLHINSGRPYTPFTIDRCGSEFGESYDARRGDPNSARLPNYWRLDLRVQKREVFDTWFFDFYIDFFNAAFQFETIDYEIDDDTGERKPVTVPLFVPMIGIRGEF